MRSGVAAVVVAFMAVAAVAAVAAAEMGGEDVWLDASNVETAPYAEWAHAHWVWLASGDANQSSVSQFVDGFLERDIPVGAVDLDSRWSSGINNFEFDTDKYPDAKALIGELASKGIHTILWVTSVVDVTSSNYKDGLSNGYYLNDGKTLKWWHGEGSWLDYTNEAAVAWWHKQMDVVLDMGVDGWKVDGTDPYVIEFGIIRGKGGDMTYREYADAYYGDFFKYTRSVRGPQALIMSRPVDDLWSFSPRDVVFSGWVGDQDPTFKGLKDALMDMLHSAWRGYVGFGSDIGGFRCCGSSNKVNGRTTALFTRWFQLGAFCSLMENGGDNQHRPWKFGEGNATLDTYRTFVHIHYELGPYLMSTGTAAYNDGTSIMRPLGIDLGPLPPSSFDYLLGPDIFVSPMTSNVTVTKLKFPDGADSWVDWWSGASHKGGSRVDAYPVGFDIFPVFHRGGAILPLRVSRAYAGHGSRAQTDALTVFVPEPTVGARFADTRRDVVYGPDREDGLGRAVAYSATADSLSFSASPHPERLVVLTRSTRFGCPQSVELRTPDGAVVSVPRVDDADELTGLDTQGFVCSAFADRSARSAPGVMDVFVFASQRASAAGFIVELQQM